MMRKKILIWGTGADAENLLKRNWMLNVFVDYFIDSTETKRFFYDRKVIKPDEVDWKAPLFIIIATSRYYNEIKKYLLEKNLQEIIDFSDFTSAKHCWLSSPANNNYIAEIISLKKSIKKLERWLPMLTSRVIKNSKEVINHIYHKKESIYEVILRCFCNEEHHLLELSENVTFEYKSIKELAVIFEELLLNEDYYFETEKKAPLIIDAGANVGLAIYYFKTLYPQSKIVAFEPMPELYNIILRNIERNHWENVMVYPYAVDGSDNDNCIFYVQDSGLAGSLEKRNQEGVSADEIREITVKCIRLSEYINESVDYLKLDVEGSETKVIEEIQDYLDKVQHIFIEFHEGRMKGYNSIAKITGVLEEKGFCVNISKSVGSARETSYQPMKYVGDRVSEVIWAKRI